MSIYKDLDLLYESESDDTSSEDLFLDKTIDVAADELNLEDPAEKVKNDIEEINNFGDDKESDDYVDSINTLFDDSVGRKDQEKVESLNECNCDIPVRKRGSLEYEANEGRQKRISTYRKLTNMDDKEVITEENLVDWAVKRTSAISCCDLDRLKSELLGQQWSEYEE